MTFQISALDHHRFTKLFELSDSEELILVNYEHQSGNSPYRAAHAIFVRKGVEQAQPAVGEVPELFNNRALSLRVFNDQAMIVAADLIEGKDLGSALDRLLTNPTAAYVHIHYAKFGCYAARADRV